MDDCTLPVARRYVALMGMLLSVTYQEMMECIGYTDRHSLMGALDQVEMYSKIWFRDIGFFSDKDDIRETSVVIDTLVYCYAEVN